MPPDDLITNVRPVGTEFWAGDDVGARRDYGSLARSMRRENRAALGKLFFLIADERPIALRTVCMRFHSMRRAAPPAPSFDGRCLETS